MFEPLEVVYPLLLNGTVSREIVESSQPTLDLRSRCSIRLQVDRIIRDQVSPLACFRIDYQAQNGTQLFFYFVGSLNLSVQSVITQGSTAGVRHHTESEEQPNTED